MEEVGRKRGGEHMDSEGRREGQRGNRRNMEAKEENVGGRKVERGMEKEEREMDKRWGKGKGQEVEEGRKKNGE